MTRKFSISALLTLAAFCLALPLAATRAGAQTTATKIATANVMKVFNEIQETKDLKSKMENDQKNLQATDLQKKTQLKDLQSARDALKPEAPDYDKANQALMQAAVDYEVWQRIQGANIQRQQKEQMLKIFNKITTAVAQVATQKGLDLVVAEQRPEVPDNLDQINVDQVRLLINQRNVLYSTPNVDISNEVITAMDAALADVRAGATGPVPAHLRDGHYAGSVRLGHAQGYRYPHDAPEGVLAQQYPPDELVGRDYYLPSDRGAEAPIAGRLPKLRRIIRGTEPASGNSLH